jgi:two-component system NtrC family sensor kinase
MQRWIMKSVRLHLLVLALLPLVVLIPALLALGMTRWSASFNALLITNVESDLQIAEQYLKRIMSQGNANIAAIAGSVSFANAKNSPTALLAYLDQERRRLGLDFLYHLPGAQAKAAAERWPVIATALAGGRQTSIDIFSAAELAQHSTDLAKKALLPLIATEAAVPSLRNSEDRGMVVHSATAIKTAPGSGVLVGGTLLNRNLNFIDTINALVYRTHEGGRQGTTTLFLEDVRISTNVRLFEDVRALGTRVSAEVRHAVLDQGQTWLNRAFVVNDWYISGYQPITDSFGSRVGMLYVGFLEAPYRAKIRSAYVIGFGALLFILILTGPLFLRMARDIFSPLERMTHTMERVQKGDLDARIGPMGAANEIGEVAAHLDRLLNQIQERDQSQRSWADELNKQVDRRTHELQTANIKLESTFQQLVMSEKLASIGEITAGVAHEINNPVAVIQGNIDVIRASLGARTEDVLTELNLIDQQVMRIDAIVGKLLQFARPSEFGAFQDAAKPNQIVKDSLVLVNHVIMTASIKIEHQAEDCPEVTISPGELQQVVVNLIMNSLQAMTGQGTLKIICGPKMRDGVSGAAIIVGDTGTGIPEAQLKTVFDPFYTTKLGAGTGLGLSISQTLVQNAGGLITARNLTPQGAEFTVWLPV